MSSTSSRASWAAQHGRANRLPSLQRVRAEKSRRRLADFFRYGWDVLEASTPLDWNWHIDAVLDHVQALVEDWRKKRLAPEEFEARIQNLLINIPPGTGKSRMVGVYVLPWVWLESPDFSAIHLSSNPRVSLRDAMYALQVIQSEWYQESFRPEWTLDRRRSGLSLFYNTEGGFRAALGFNARITGDRAHAIFVDDPHDAEEAKSEALRQSVLDRWDSALGNRVNDMRASIRVGIMQRLHEKDWSGHILQQGGWEHLKIPMEFEEKSACHCETCERGETAIGWRDPRERPGQILDPRRFTEKVLAAERVRLGSYGFAGQMQQRPSPDDGGIFKKTWWRYYHELPYKVDEWLTSWDLTFKGKADSDRVVGGLWARVGADRYLVDIEKGRYSFTQTKERIRAFLRKHPQAGLHLVEDKANGPAIIDELRGEIAGLVAVEPDGDKVARAHAVTPAIESGNVLLPSPVDRAGRPIAGREWVEEFVDELARFPNGANDDQVDMATQALRRFKQAPGWTASDWKGYK